MKNTKSLWMASLALILAGLLAGNAWADRPSHHRPHRSHSSVHFGIYVGEPFRYSPYFHPYPLYAPRIYVPPVVVTQPPVYIEQPIISTAVPTLEPGFWYYCNEAQAYYPYVKQCAGTWQKVSPRPTQ